MERTKHSTIKLKHKHFFGVKSQQEDQNLLILAAQKEREKKIAFIYKKENTIPNLRENWPGWMKILRGIKKNKAKTLVFQ